MLWGNSDTVIADRGKIRVTMHHSEITDLVQRGPRVRFGQVHVYNNLYRATADSGYLYSYSGRRHRVEDLRARTTPSSCRRRSPPPTSSRSAQRHRDPRERHPVNGKPADVLAAYNAVNDPDLSSDVGWTPTLHTRIDPTWAVPALVHAGAGAR